MNERWNLQISSTQPFQRTEVAMTVTSNTSMWIINILQNFHLCHLEPSLWLREVKKNKYISSMRKLRLRDKGICQGHPSNKWQSHDLLSGLSIPNLIPLTLSHLNSSKAGRQTFEPRTADMVQRHFQYTTILSLETFFLAQTSRL